MLSCFPVTVIWVIAAFLCISNFPYRIPAYNNVSMVSLFYIYLTACLSDRRNIYCQFPKLCHFTEFFYTVVLYRSNPSTSKLLWARQGKHNPCTLGHLRSFAQFNILMRNFSGWRDHGSVEVDLFWCSGYSTVHTCCNTWKRKKNYQFHQYLYNERMFCSKTKPTTRKWFVNA